MPDYVGMSDKDLVDALGQIKYIGDIFEIKKEGIHRGNHVIVLKAGKLLEQSDMTMDLVETLEHAVGKYGWSFDDSGTRIGGLFQMLYGRKFIYNFGSRYTMLTRTERDNVNKKLWEETHHGCGSFN